MFIYTFNILTLPFVFVWAIVDAWLIAALLWLFLRHARAVPPKVATFGSVIERPVNYVRDLLCRIFQLNASSAWSWILTVALALMLRQLLVTILFAGACHIVR
jgi:hypothetical protein